MLNMIKFAFEFISDADMYLLFEKSMTSRVSYISRDIAKPTISMQNRMTRNKKSVI